MQAILDQSGLMVVVLSRTGRIRLFNAACEAVTGFGANEILGRPIWNLLLPDETDGVRRVFSDLVSCGLPSEHTNRWRTRSGSSRLIHWKNTALRDTAGHIRLVVGTGIDLTELQDSRDELRHHDAQLRAAVDAMPGLVAHADAAHKVLFANHAYREWFGLDPEAQVGRHLRDVIGDSAYATLRPHFDRAARGESSTYHGEICYADGRKRFIHGTYVPKSGGNAGATSFYINVLDLTEQEALKAALAAESRRSQVMLENAIDAIVTIDRHGRIESYNPAAERIFGYSVSEVLGRNVSMLMPSPHAEMHDQYLANYLRTGNARVIGVGRELQAQRKDGHVIDIELAIGEFQEGDERYFTGFVRDISDRKHAEAQAQKRLQQLAHMNRLGAMSMLTSGLAHEISQPLMAVATLAHMCRTRLQEAEGTSDTLVKALDDIVEHCDRAGRIVSEMRSFLRKDDRASSRADTLSLNELIAAVLPLLDHEFRVAGIRLKLELDPSLPPVRVNGIQIEQVLLNLLRNAVEAMTQQEGDRLLQVDSRRKCNVGAACEVSIRDSGPGIDEELMPRLFDPFTSTKENGLGQGLAISRAIVEAHGGQLKGENDPNGGARFSFTLPTDAADG